MSSSSRKMLQAAAGSAKKEYLEDYFNITYYTGSSGYSTNANPREIETGVDISVDGGCMFFYSLDDGVDAIHAFVSTDYNNGLTHYFHQEDGNPVQTDSNGIQSLTLDGVRKGFKMGPSTVINKANHEYAVVTFRKKEKFMASMVVDGNTGWDNVSNPLNHPPIAAWYFRIDATQAPLYWQIGVGNDMGSSDQYFHLEWDNTTGVDGGSFGYGDAEFWDYSPSNTASLLQLGTTVRSTGFGKEGILVMLGPGYEFSHNGQRAAINTFGYQGNGSYLKGFNTTGSGHSNGAWQFTNDQWMFIKRSDNNNNTPTTARWWMFFDQLGLKCGSGYFASQYYVSHNKNNNSSYFGVLNKQDVIRAENSGYYITTTDAAINANNVRYLGLAVATPAVLQQPVSGEQIVSIRDGLTPSHVDYPGRSNNTTWGSPYEGMVQGLFDSSDVSGWSSPDFCWFNGDNTNGNEAENLCHIDKTYPYGYQKVNDWGGPFVGRNISTTFHNPGNVLGGGTGGALTQNLNKMRDGFFVYSVHQYGGSSVSNRFSGGTNNSAADVTFCFYKARPKVMSYSYTIANTGSYADDHVFHNLDGGCEMCWVVSSTGSVVDRYVWHKVWDTGNQYDSNYYIKMNSSEGQIYVTTANLATQHPFAGYNPLRAYTDRVYTNNNVVGDPTYINNYPFRFTGWRTFPGVTKVGSYTGTGSNLTVDCGFSGPARYMLIKRYDDNGRWYLFLNDPRSNTAGGTGMVIQSNGSAAVIAWPALTNSGEQYLTSNGNTEKPRETGMFFNAGAAGSGMEGGFKLSNHSDATTTININGASYLFLAIA